MPEGPEEPLSLCLGSPEELLPHLRVLGRGGTWGTWCPRGPECPCTWQHRIVCPLPQSSWVQPPRGPLQSVPSTGDTSSVVTGVRDSGCSRLQPAAVPPPRLPPPGCAVGKLRHGTGQGGEAIAVAAPLPCLRGAGSGSARAQRCHLSCLVSEGWRASGDEAAP